MFDNRVCTDDEVVVERQASATEINDNLEEVLHPLLVPLYERFAFFELPMQLVADEVQALRPWSLLMVKDVPGADVTYPVVDLFAGPGGLGEGFASLDNGKGVAKFESAVSIERGSILIRDASPQALSSDFSDR